MSRATYLELWGAEDHLATYLTPRGLEVVGMVAGSDVVEALEVAQSEADKYGYTVLSVECVS